MLKLLFPLFSLFYNKDKWEKKSKKNYSPYSPEELFVASILGWLTASTVLLAILSLPLISAYFEMKAFNRLCNSNVTFTDALFAELRITKECTSSNE